MKLAVGGATWLTIASTVMIPSAAPAPPSRCPTIDLVEDTATLCAASSPRPTLVAAVSAGSFLAVPVPWELT